MPVAATLPETLRGLAAQRRPLALLVGRYGLIHAGTLDFIEAARREAGEEALLVAAVIDPSTAPEANGSAGDKLLRPEERLRILEAIELLSGAAMLPCDPETIDACREATPGARWLADAGEAALPEILARHLELAGVTLGQLATPPESERSERILERMARPA